RKERDANPHTTTPPPPPPPRQRAAEASIDADPLVRQLREQFAAVVRDGTIEPLEAKA
ncbi:hypothetical protein ACIUYA_21865, partial [Pseudomonas aeruginosa]